MSEPQKPKSYRLQFTDEERASPELDKYIKKSEKAADRLDAANAAIPKKNKIVKERTFDEAAGKAKTRLHFEKQDKPPSDARGKHKSPLRPVAQAELYVHGKIHEVEKDNSGVEAAHKSEELAEGAAKYGARKLKEGYHSHKLKPYRAAAKAEKAAIKANAEFKYQKALQENPQIAASNPFSRFMQKQRIKREYAKAAKNGGIKSAKKTAENAGKAAKKTAEATKNTVSFVAKHWKGVLIGICALLLFVIISAGVTSCVSLLTGGMSTVVGSSYVAEDADMFGAEADYKAKEAALQSRVDNIERTYSGYNEYRYFLDSIGHDPYVLTSILTTLHLDYTRAGVQDTLQTIFDMQYSLMLTSETEVRYRTETRIGSYQVTDEETGEVSTVYYEYEVEVPYNYYILNVSLTSEDMAGLTAYLMTDEQFDAYLVYMQTKGNRPDLFP